MKLILVIVWSPNRRAIKKGKLELYKYYYMNIDLIMCGFFEELKESECHRRNCVQMIYFLFGYNHNSTFVVS